jgi:hypothetical protein
LGHGNSDHIRRPKKVAALQGKKVISIATGSLHCIAVSYLIFFLIIKIVNHFVSFSARILASAFRGATTMKDNWAMEL